MTRLESHAARGRILLVEDDARLGQQVLDHLRTSGYDAAWVTSGEDAIAAWSQPFDLMILDLMLPGIDGFAVMEALRKRMAKAPPVLVVSAQGGTADKRRAFELGAGDFLAKPFWPEELLLRVDARLRPSAIGQDGSPAAADELALDLEARRATVKGAPIALSDVEFDLLAALARRPGAAIPGSWLEENVLGTHREGKDSTLDVQISRLREKLGPAGSRIATVWGIGYRLESPA